MHSKIEQRIVKLNHPNIIYVPDITDLLKKETKGMHEYLKTALQWTEPQNATFRCIASNLEEEALEYESFLVDPNDTHTRAFELLFPLTEVIHCGSEKKYSEVDTSSGIFADFCKYGLIATKEFKKQLPAKLITPTLLVYDCQTKPTSYQTIKLKEPPIYEAGRLQLSPSKAIRYALVGENE